MQNVTAYLSFGSNLGERDDYVARALELLEQNDQLHIEQVSTIIETEPVGGPSGQGKYLNGALRITTTLSPQELLKLANTVEADLGRIRTVRNGPRTIDIDILLYGDQHVDEPNLTIPHPRMWDRDFVLVPLRQVYAGDLDALIASH